MINTQITVSQLLTLIAEKDITNVFLSDNLITTIFLDSFLRKYSPDKTICKRIQIDNNRLVILCDKFELK